MGKHWGVPDAFREIVQNWFDQAFIANNYRPPQVSKSINANGSIAYTLIGSIDGLGLSEFQKRW